jgi:hypothetical protein
MPPRFNLLPAGGTSKPKRPWNSFLCQPTTVSGEQFTSHDRRSEYSREIPIQNRRSAVFSFGLVGAVRRNTAS